MSTKRKYPTSYFYSPVINFIWGGIAIYEIPNLILRRCHKIYSILLIGIFGFGYMLAEIIHIYKNLNKLEETTLTLCYLIAHFIGIGKVVTFLVKRNEIGRFISSLEEGLFLPDFLRGGNQEKTIVQKAIKQCSTQAKIFLVAVAFMIGSNVTKCLLKRKAMVYDPVTNCTLTVPIFPYPASLPFEFDKGASPYYELMFLYQTISISLFGWYLGNADTIITGLMIHVTAQFKIVTNAVLTVAERAERIYSLSSNNGLNKKIKTLNEFEIARYEKNMEIILKTCVKDCIKHHYAILNLLDNCESTFNIIFLIQFLGSLLALCVGLYQTSLLPITNPLFISMSLFTIAMTFQLFLYCWNANEVSVSSVEVAQAAYNAQWIPANKDVKLSLMLLTLRAQRACYLTAGKFSKITLETFISIIRGSGSYFMVLKQMNEEMQENN